MPLTWPGHTQGPPRSLSPFHLDFVPVAPALLRSGGWLMQEPLGSWEQTEDLQTGEAQDDHSASVPGLIPASVFPWGLALPCVPWFRFEVTIITYIKNEDCPGRKDRASPSRSMEIGEGSWFLTWVGEPSFPGYLVCPPSTAPSCV